MCEQDQVDELVLEALDSGRTPEEVCRDFPELLPQVRATWLRVRAVDAEFSSILPSSNGFRETVVPFDGQLPEIPGYEIQRVLGRGGFAIVYLARHTRLGRLVAVKMLLAGQYARPNEVNRFSREARTLADLHHPNIVQVFDVGDYNGCPYFTMEYVNGGTLADRLKERPLPAKEAAALTATFADAIHVAHQDGVVHRDLTPSNILFASDGTPKIVDFGLARQLTGSEHLTITGAALGTPGYMAPEQANRRGGEIGPGADVHALGAILYKMVTGRPPFQAETTALTIRQLLFDEPIPPSKLNPNVPRDLETICLKCLSKEPEKRYETAADLAADVRRFQRGEPIVARRISSLARAARWARRRPSLSAALAMGVLLTFALVATFLRWHAQQTEVRAAAVAYAEADLRESQRLLESKEFQASAEVLQRAKDRLSGFVSPGLRDRLSTAFANLELVKRLDAIRLVRCSLVGGHFDRLRSDREYEEAFRTAGIGAFDLAPKLVADRINGSQARSALVAALDDWAVCAGHELRRNWLLEVTRLADRDPWRDRARNAQLYWDLEHLKELTRTAPVEGQSVQLLVALGERLHTADPKAALPFLRRVQQAYPDDFFANFWVGYAEEPSMAVGYNRVAQALRPNTVVANRNLANALRTVGSKEEAIPYLRRVLAIDPGDSDCRYVLDESRTDIANAHQDAAHALQAQRQWAEAITHLRAAVDLVPERASVHYDLGMALNSPGHQEEAIEELRKTLAIDPNYPGAHVSLGLILLEQGQLEQAVAAIRRAIELDPPDGRARAGLREAFARLGRFEELRAVWREPLKSAPSDHDAWFGYAELCLFLKDEEEYRSARRELLAHFGAATDPVVAERTARACLLRPASADELRQAVALADRAVAAGRSGREAAYPYFLFAQGVARYREGKSNDAIELMNGEAARVMGPGPKLITAMAQCQKGQKDKARKALDEAVASYDWNTAKAVDPEAWTLHIFRREAEALIRSDVDHRSDKAD